ncbi:MAG: hypothetical protein EXS05_18230 [Planctomycetaceae bacterium]|nr:hypothetical protein [Planctomycetaceae bacterium]
MLIASHSRSRVIPVALLALILLDNSGCSGTSTAPAEDGRATVEPFLASIRNDQLDAAWESTTAEFKSDLGREAFHRFAQTHPVLKDALEFAGYQPDSTNGITRGECTFKSAAGAAAVAKVRVLVAREGDKWKVERLIVE